MAWLAAKNYESIFLDEWFAIRTGKKTGTGKQVCLSFDDGLLDNWVYAFPIARKYGMRFTLFISPECVDKQEVVRLTLEDVWRGNCQLSDLQALGYLSWDELKIMQESGIVDVQSHTMTHAKYISSTALKGFYYGGFEGMHTILNAHPDIRSRYMHDLNFENYLPWGTPLFEEGSSVIVKKHFIRTAFLEEVQTLAAGHHLEVTEQRSAFEQKARKTHESYLQSGQLLDALETDTEYHARIGYEIADSKSIIGDRLKKPVQFLCWPHGDNTAEVHELAKETGYLATTSGKMSDVSNHPDRIPRTGADFNNSLPISRLRFRYQVGKHYRKQPWQLMGLANDLRHAMRKTTGCFSF
jgi:hypothetical protein